MNTKNPVWRLDVENQHVCYRYDSSPWGEELAIKYNLNDSQPFWTVIFDLLHNQISAQANRFHEVENNEMNCCWISSICKSKTRLRCFNAEKLKYLPRMINSKGERKHSLMYLWSTPLQEVPRCWVSIPHDWIKHWSVATQMNSMLQANFTCRPNWN